MSKDCVGPEAFLRGCAKRNEGARKCSDNLAEPYTRHAPHRFSQKSGQTAESPTQGRTFNYSDSHHMKEFRPKLCS